jgi:vacuolar iron transporter family protein
LTEEIAAEIRREDYMIVANAITSDPERWVKFMMRFELGLERPEAGREFKSALTISSAYIAGGLLPLAPYIILDSVSGALTVSVALSLAALLIFGAVKGHFTGVAPVRSALQTTIGGIGDLTGLISLRRLAQTSA